MRQGTAGYATQRAAMLTEAWPASCLSTARAQARALGGDEGARDMKDSNGDLIIYRGPEGTTRVEVRHEGDTF